MGSKIIAVIGAPGVGKTFLVKRLAKKLNAIPILEDVAKFPKRILENFKKNTRQMETVIWFRNKQIEDMKKAVELKEKGNLVIMDTYPISNELHITSMTSGFEQEILLKQAQIDREYIPKPDIVLLIDASEDTIRKLTLERGRDFDTNEQFIQRNLSIKETHDNYLKESGNSLIYINRDDLDFKKDEDIQKVMDKIKLD